MGDGDGGEVGGELGGEIKGSLGQEMLGWFRETGG